MNQRGYLAQTAGRPVDIGKRIGMEVVPNKTRPVTGPVIILLFFSVCYRHRQILVFHNLPVILDQLVLQILNQLW